MNNKLYYFTQTLYSYFKVSLYFWLYLLKGLIIYGLIPSTCALFLTMNAIIEEKDDQGVKSLFKTYYEKYKKYKGQSFLFSLVLSFLFAALFYLSKQQKSAAFIFIIVCCYFLALAAILFIYCTYLLSFRNLTFKQSIIFSFVTAFRNLFITLGTLIVILALLFAAYENFAFFMIFGPFLFGLAILFIFRRLKYWFPSGDAI